MKLFLVLTGILFCLLARAQEQGEMDSAIYYINKGQYALALPFAKRSFEAVKNTGNDSAYISVTNKLSAIYVELMKLDSARVYYGKAIEKTKKIYGENSAEYGCLIVCLGRVYTDLGQYRDAEQWFQEAEQHFQNITDIFGKIDSLYNQGDGGYYKAFYTSYLINYAYFHMKTGNLKKADELSTNVCEIALREPVDGGAYLSGLSHLIILYRKMGFYEKLNTTIVRLFEGIKETYSEKHPAYTQGIGSLADIYQRNGHLEKADSMFRKALDIREQAIGKNAANNIPILNRLGIVNMEMGKYEVAESYLEAAAEIIRENGGEAFTYYAYSTKNLARLYALTGRKKLAEPLFQKCLAIYNGLGMELHSDRLKVLHDMAELLYADDVDKAAIYLQEAMTAENKLLLEKLEFLSEMELLAYIRANKDVAESSPYRFLLRHTTPAIAGAAYNSRLLAGSIGLQNTRTLYQNMTQPRDSTLSTLWQNYLQQKSFYTNLLLTPVTQRNINTDSVGEVLNRQEKEILRRSADYRDMKENLAITWQDIRRSLKPGETAIEFVRFNGKYITTRAEADTVYYAALLLRPQDSAPQFIVLCERRQLTDAIKKFPYKAVLNSRGRKAAARHQSATNALYQLVWQPLESYLTETKTVYFSPAGMLHRVAFAAIPCKSNELLCDRYDLIQLASTRQVALQESRSPAPVSIAMFGGINYSRQSADAGVPVSPDPYAWVYRESRGADLDSFSFLPHTLQEINTIKTNTETLQKRAVAFTADNATEAVFRNLGGDHSPEVIHFATHGFTLPDTVQENDAGAVFKASDNPLLRCGLVMAGGNKGWKGEAGLNEDDGILTGLEISAVQLPNTQLAVLSACETGLGRIEGSEGVFGLQRAFKLAGVDYVMASLWQVPDKETSEFMETFYTYWLNGKTIREAFLHTQQIMRKQYAPYYWAGFTLVQ
ncbi:MAG: CHAT domain-containing protein [Chitinophagaceae bacterium]|nr:CHAT domain-containing protein [Chitinophagaceae bacterium]